MSIDSDSRLVREWGMYRRRPHRGLPAWLWLLLAVGLAVVFAVAVWLSQRSQPWRSPSGVPHFVSCAYGGRINGWCGVLRTPADPREPHGSTIALRVTVIPATVPPAAGALFYLEGGPGGAASASAVRVNALFARVGRHRDLVMVDERGTGGSGRLACPNGYVRGSDAHEVAAYVHRCLVRLGTDPRLYTTSVAADDLETVRRALGYRKIDLYGGSYGATLAQAYLRRYSASVRSVVLDSGSLPRVRIYDVAARNAERALDEVFARCEATTACRKAYPSPRRQLGALLARRARLVTFPGGRVVLRPDDIAWTVDWLSESPANAAIIPFAVNAAAHGDYTTLASTYAGQLGGSNLDRLGRLVPFWATICSEPWAAFDPGATARAGRGSYLRAAAVARADLFRRVCRVVPKGRVAAGAGTAAVAHVPVLLLAGSADPLDPPANVKGWRRLFPEGRLVVVRGAGHGTIELACAQTLVARFVDSGSARQLDPTCARHVSLPAFVTG
jgi:pimeloyl-ACP methyl ester carboxylesterase